MDVNEEILEILKLILLAGGGASLVIMTLAIATLFRLLETLDYVRWLTMRTHLRDSKGKDSFQSFKK